MRGIDNQDIEITSGMLNYSKDILKSFCI